MYLGQIKSQRMPSHRNRMMSVTKQTLGRHSGLSQVLDSIEFTGLMSSK